MPVDPSKAKLKRRSSRKELRLGGSGIGTAGLGSEGGVGVDSYMYRFDGHGRELEIKRNRGEVSCAECRRLKIKCDKQIPCQSCQRRGCAALCPNGSLATGQGTRFVLAATEHLHRRIATLSNRVRQLEDALATLQAKHSPEPHPLLHADLLHMDEGDDAIGTGTSNTGINASGGEINGVKGNGGVKAGGIGDEDGIGRAAKEALDAFGTLSISEHGISRFFGPTGGSESLLIANLDAHDSGSPRYTYHTSTPESGSLRSSKSPQSSSSASHPPSTDDLTMFSQSFPFTPMGQPADVQGFIESHLPSHGKTITICETYFEQVSWLFRGVTRMQLVDEMIPVIYRERASDSPPIPGQSQADSSYNLTSTSNSTPSTDEDYTGPHSLALLFMVLAIGSLVSPNDSSNAWGEHFHQIARAAISLQPVLEKPSIVTIQTLHLMSIYNAMSGSDLKSDTSMEMTWSLITLAAHLSQTIGLHRDSARWGLSPKMVQRRRILFWDLFVADVWQSLNTGRPPSFSLKYIDCAYPEAQEDGIGSAFGIWQCRFAAECVAEVTARTLTAEAPSYATIMDLDRKVREFPLPDGLSSESSNINSNVIINASIPVAVPHSKPRPIDEDLSTSFQRCVLDHIRETILLYIHRSFFAQSIIEHPINPLKSPYAPSFLAAYRASSTILKSVKEQFAVWPNSCSRFWTMWTFAFSAAVVFGTVVTRGPRSPLATNAMAELDSACALFSKASVYSIRATKALPILKKLNDKARQALSAAQHDIPMPLPSSERSDRDNRGGALWNLPNSSQQITIKQEEKELDDELSIFAGHTRFVSGATTKKGGGDGVVLRDVNGGVGEIPPPPLRLHNPHANGFEPGPMLYTLPSSGHGKSAILMATSTSTSSASTLSDQHMSGSPTDDRMEVQPPHTHYDYSDHGRRDPDAYHNGWHDQRNPKRDHEQPRESYATYQPHQLPPPPTALQPSAEYSQPSQRYTQPQPQAHQHQHYHIQPPHSGSLISDLRTPHPNANSHYAAQYPPSRHRHSNVHPVTPIAIPILPSSVSHSHLHHSQDHSTTTISIPPASPVNNLPSSASISGGYAMYSNDGQPHQSQHSPSHYTRHPQQLNRTYSHSSHQPPPQQQHCPTHQNDQHYTGGAPPNMDLANLGLASRDSKLDERWGSFMADSGLLEDFRRR